MGIVTEAVVVAVEALTQIVEVVVVLGATETKFSASVVGSLVTLLPSATSVMHGNPRKMLQVHTIQILIHLIELLPFLRWLQWWQLLI